MRQKSGTKKAACRSGDSLDNAFSHRPWHVNRPDYAQMARVDPGYDRHRMLCISCPIGFFHTVAAASAAVAWQLIGFFLTLCGAAVAYALAAIPDRPGHTLRA